MKPRSNARRDGGRTTRSNDRPARPTRSEARPRRDDEAPPRRRDDDEERPRRGPRGAAEERPSRSGPARDTSPRARRDDRTDRDERGRYGGQARREDAPRPRAARRSDESTGDRVRRTFRKDEGERPARASYRRESRPNDREGERRQRPDERRSYGDRPSRPPYRSADRGTDRPYPRKPRPDFRRDDDRGARSGGDRPYRSRPERDFTPNRTGQGRGRAPKRKQEAKPDHVRLNRFIANAGICSRREADDLIVAGTVKVNGEVVTALGTLVGPNDVIHYGGQRISTEKKRYVLVNKPKDTITTTDDPHDRRTVMALVADACAERLYPVGRLDRNTTGVLLLTNDGDLAKKLTHPSHGAEKLYHVTLDKKVALKDLRQLTEGVALEDGPAAADEASYVGDKKDEVGLKLHMGRNRVVRRMFEALGYEVVKLDRVVFAGLTKKELQRGEWRHLTEQEVGWLKRMK